MFVEVIVAVGRAKAQWEVQSFTDINFTGGVTGEYYATYF